MPRSLSESRWHDQAHRERVGLRVDEAAAADALGAAEELLGGALPRRPGRSARRSSSSVRRRAPARPEPTCSGREALVQAGLLGQQRQRAVAGDHQRRLDDVVDAGHPHAAHGAVAHHQPLDQAAVSRVTPAATACSAYQRSNRGRNRVKPVRVRSERRSRRPPTGRVGARAGLEGQRGGRAFADDGQDALGHRRSQGARCQKPGTSSSGAGQSGHHAAEHVLGARVLAPLEQQDLGPGRARPSAALVPAGPAPTTMASKLPSGRPRGACIASPQASSRHALIFAIERGQDLSRSPT